MKLTGTNTLPVLLGSFVNFSDAPHSWKTNHVRMDQKFRLCHYSAAQSHGKELNSCTVEVRRHQRASDVSGNKRQSKPTK